VGGHSANSRRRRKTEWQGCLRYFLCYSRDINMHHCCACGREVIIRQTDISTYWSSRTLLMAASSKPPPQPFNFIPSLEVLYKGGPRHVSVQHFIGGTVRTTFAEHTATNFGVVVGDGGVKSVTRTDSNMGISWRRRGVSQTSIVAYVILFIVVVALVTEARPAKGAGHKRRHGSSGKRRSVGAERSLTTPHRRHHRYDRALDLSDAANLTLCSYSVHNDVSEDRVPKVIQHVKCVENGCRCSVVNNIGTYAYTQLVTSMLVTINNQQVTLSDVPYAYVCASVNSGILGREFNYERFMI